VNANHSEKHLEKSKYKPNQEKNICCGKRFLKKREKSKRRKRQRAVHNTADPLRTEHRCPLAGGVRLQEVERLNAS